MCVVGVANGRLSLEVMRFSRSRLFFFCRFPDPSPSTSACDLNRLGDDLAGGGVAGEGKAKVVEEPGSHGNGKLSRRALDLAVRHSKSISTRLGRWHYHDGRGLATMERKDR